MPVRRDRLARAAESYCSIERALAAVPDDWTLLLVREALLGRRTFAQFREGLGVATDVLTARLSSLVADGILVKTPYREPGQRERHAYDLTDAGRELIVPLVALQQWGARHRPSPTPAAVVPTTASSGGALRVVLIDDRGSEVAAADARFTRVGGTDASSMVGEGS